MKDKTKTTVSSRRTFLKTSLGAVAAAGFPAIVPSSVFGQLSPSNRINLGPIGVVRISRGHDLPGLQTNPADRRAAEVVEAVLSRLRTRPQRPHRRDQARRDRIAWRSCRR